MSVLLLGDFHGENRMRNSEHLHALERQKSTLELITGTHFRGSCGVAGTLRDCGGDEKTESSPRETWGDGSVLTEAICVPWGGLAPVVIISYLIGAVLLNHLKVFTRNY